VYNRLKGLSVLQVDIAAARDFIYLVVLKNEFRASCMLGKSTTT
jgi:hypothetical protein